jgi:hypothetical protein
VYRFGLEIGSATTCSCTLDCACVGVDVSLGGNRIMIEIKGTFVIGTEVGARENL